MLFNDHSRLEGRHAFLSASSYSWVNYSEEKLEARFRSSLEAARGTRLHNLAAEAIKLGIRQARSNQTLSRYINDAISYRMTPEQILFYSENAFGTADAIRYRDGELRIHDLKTGVTPTKMTQLEVYTALFCLEYGAKPGKLDVKLRIYQNDDILEHTPDPEDIIYIMDKIVSFDKKISEMKNDFR